MIKRYLLASFFGGMIGAACVLVIVYVTNTKALAIHDARLEPAVNALHARINDFYIFAGIVITLLLAINVGVFVRADEEVDRQIEETFGKRRDEIDDLADKTNNLYELVQRRDEIQKSRFKGHNKASGFEPGND